MKKVTFDEDYENPKRYVAPVVKKSKIEDVIS